MDNILSTKPDAIYDQISYELDSVIRSISKLPNEESLNEEKSNATSILAKYQDDLKRQLRDLQQNSEWERFTIAFYGETGAGKSTLIETLRILLNEPSKVKQRTQFALTDQQVSHIDKHIATLESEIQALCDLMQQNTQQLNATRERFAAHQHILEQSINETNVHYHAANELLQAQLDSTKAVLDEVNQKVQHLERHLAYFKKSASLWAKFKRFFSKLPEEHELLTAQLSLEKAKVAYAASIAQSQRATQRWQQERLALEQQLAQTHSDCEQACTPLTQKEKRTVQRLVILKSEQDAQVQLKNELLEQLAQHADGEIIGIGSSDTTKSTHQYNFSLAGQEFSLLDVPGIEGKEATVIAQIEVAIQKAHAVFYMTNKPAAPQKGDGGTKGTLEKIKEHLGSQTEVWSIYNKKITSPKNSLKNKLLASESELESINAPDASGLNFSMREQLGHHYRDTVALAALPAFLASTDHFLPDSQNFKRRSKAMEDFTPKELLHSSGLNDFLELLGGPLVMDAKVRIQRSNFNKAHEALKTTLNMVQKLKSNFSALAVNLGKKEVDAKSQLQSSFQSLRLRLQSSGSNLIRDFESKVRQEIYSRIDDDISNDDFKSELSNCIDRQQRAVLTQLPNVMSREVERFKSDVQGVVKRFAEQVNELSAIYTLLNKNLPHRTFDINIKLNNGSKTGSLLLNFGRAIVAIFPGSLLLCVAAAGLILSFWKSTHGFFDSDFRKSEQRKSSNQNLSKIVKQLEMSMEDGLNKALIELKNRLSMIEAELELPARETRTLVSILDYSNNRLTLTSKQIVSLGGLQ